jgi:hypothetical protein
LVNGKNHMKFLLSFLFALVLSVSAHAQCAVSDATPAFVGGGNLWGRTSSQVNQYFGLKADANNGLLCDPVIQQLITFPDNGIWSTAGVLNTSINNTPIGLTTPAPGAFTTLTSNGQTVNAGHGLIGFQTFCASGCTHTSGATYTPDTGTNSIIIDIQAPGGGSGGCASTTSGQTCATAGAAGGSFVEAYFNASFSGIVVTAPGGGAAGSAGNNAGTTGSSASFGSAISCPGGTGSSGGAAASAPTSWTAVAASTAAPSGCSLSGAAQLLYAIAGGAGANAVAAGSAANQQQGGSGGISNLGIPSPGVFCGTTCPGTTGSGYGAGASGSAQTASQSAVAGAAGGGAIVIIKEFN